MYNLVRLLLVPIVAIILACGSSTKTMTIPTESKTPWENLAGEEARFFANRACSETTEIIAVAKTWPLLKLEDRVKNPRLLAGETNRYLELRGVASAGLLMAFQYRVDSDGRVTVEGAALFIAGSQFLILDFYTLRGIFAGKVTAEDGSEAFHRFATGRFFCIFG